MCALYSPSQTSSFKLSRSKFDLFINCPYCFFVDRTLGISRPSGPAFTLNKAVDTLLKKEFDMYRALQEPHPLLAQYRLAAIPYQPEPANLITKWRNTQQGISFLHPPTNFEIYGAIDVIWVTPYEELIIVDYKATSKDGDVLLDQEYHNSYRRQLDLYAWLFKMNGYQVHNKAYWVYCNGIKSMEKFGNCLHFKTSLIDHQVNTDWIEEKLIEAHECLNLSEPPARSGSCDFCNYLDEIYYIIEFEK